MFFSIIIQLHSCPLLHLFSYLNLSGKSGRNCLSSPSALSGCNGPTDSCFSRETTQLMSWPDVERYSCSLETPVVSPLLSLVYTLVFSWTGGVLFHQNSSTHKLPRSPPRNLCSLITLAVWSLVFAGTDKAFC